MADKEKFTDKIILAGFGGQGVLLVGRLIAYSGMIEDYQVSWIPSYGPEMRGGTCNCNVIVSTHEVGSPVISLADTAIVMNLPSMDKFEPLIKKGGLMIYNKSLVDREPKRSDITCIGIPATKMAEELGSTKVANMLMLGAYLEFRKKLEVKHIEESMKKILSESNAKHIPMNVKAMEMGAEFVKKLDL